MNGKNRKIKISFVFLLLFFCFSILTACSELEKTEPQSFYAETAPPPKKEFRWSNGKMPKSFDPALASAPPETDVVRAVFEGLTDTNPKTLETIPAIAIDWTSSEDNKTWTFKLRRDAKWSNGEQVTANDFVRSWMRLKEMGDKVAHYKLLNNIVGMQIVDNNEFPSNSDNLELFTKKSIGEEFSPIFQKPTANSNSAQKPPIKSDNSLDKSETGKKNAKEINNEGSKTPQKEIKSELQFGVEAIDNHTLRISLINADKNFPALAANPIFRPIYGNGKEFEGDELNAGIVTNGAFRVFSIGQDGVTLDRAEYYWDSRQIKLDRVRFVPTENAEKALEAYRAGEVDAVTNASFEPLALKLLTPFKDFERTTHSALNFYEFNPLNKPFQDRRVREALAIGIERERLTEDEMDGASRPALSFLPFNEDTKLKLSQDTEKAKNLLTEAGFPNGENFPTVRLLINRNNMQQRIARSVAKMWKENLNVETEITIKESNELDTAKKSGNFDLTRRGVVLPTTDETANMLAIFSTNENLSGIKESEKNIVSELSKIEKSKQEQNPTEQINNSSPTKNITSDSDELLMSTSDIFNNIILTEAEALYELPAIPLYFPTSYSLVKPYILGFETNNLDAPSLKEVRIDNNWQPKKLKNES